MDSGYRLPCHSLVDSDGRILVRVIPRDVRVGADVR
jgi:hypothetical protein